MDINIIVPTRQNATLEKELKRVAALHNGKTIHLHFLELPKMPARRLDEVLWRDIKDKDALIIVVNPQTEFLEDDFISQFVKHCDGRNILAREGMEPVAATFEPAGMTTIRKNDCFCFSKMVYRRYLGDLSPHSDLMTCMRELVKRIGASTVHVPDTRTLKVQKEFELKRKEKIEERKRVEDELRRQAERIENLRKLSEDKRKEAIDSYIKEQKSKRLELKKKREKLAEVERISRMKARAAKLKDDSWVSKVRPSEEQYLTYKQRRERASQIVDGKRKIPNNTFPAKEMTEIVELSWD